MVLGDEKMYSTTRKKKNTANFSLFSQVSLTGIPRTITSTNLTAQQIQQLAANRGTANMATIQTVLRGTGIAGEFFAN